MPVNVRAKAVPLTVTELASDALSTPLTTLSVSTSDSPSLPLPASRSAPVNTKALAVPAVIVTVCGKATMSGAVAVPLWPSVTATGVCAVSTAVLTVCASTWPAAWPLPRVWALKVKVRVPALPL